LSSFLPRERRSDRAPLTHMDYPARSPGTRWPHRSGPSPSPQVRPQLSDGTYQLADRNGEDNDIAASDGRHVTRMNSITERSADLRCNRIVDNKRDMRVQVRGNELAEGTETDQSDRRGSVDIRGHRSAPSRLRCRMPAFCQPPDTQRLCKSMRPPLCRRRIGAGPEKMDRLAHGAV
jgi:hypothetical protein